jgi:hypothetical protein
MAALEVSLAAVACRRSAMGGDVERLESAGSRYGAARSVKDASRRLRRCRRMGGGILDRHCARRSARRQASTVLPFALEALHHRVSRGVIAPLFFA